MARRLTGATDLGYQVIDEDGSLLFDNGTLALNWGRYRYIVGFPPGWVDELGTPYTSMGDRDRRGKANLIAFVQEVESMQSEDALRQGRDYAARLSAEYAFNRAQRLGGVGPRSAQGDAPRFRKMAPGLYGTGIYRKSRDSDYYDDTLVEVVIDRIDPGSWYDREWSPETGLTGFLGDWSPTLAAAKEAILRDYQRGLYS